MSDVNTSKLLDALRQIGVDVPDKPPTTLSVATYWLISNGALSTCVDQRDASSEAEAIKVARTDLLQPWYINGHLADAITVKQITRNEYLNWIQKGVS